MPLSLLNIITHPKSTEVAGWIDPNTAGSGAAACAQRHRHQRMWLPHVCCTMCAKERSQRIWPLSHATWTCGHSGCLLQTLFQNLLMDGRIIWIFILLSILCNFDVSILWCCECCHYQVAAVVHETEKQLLVDGVGHGVLWQMSRGK